ncbi:hypothetical protein [Eudoraea chungangensis]|uniref:hypothetical protein n=1 Tax=Eudoraea chungangensis TaxID=1481905 RepID=UPI0023EBC01D|nr:hypothetical protein [Eudoraea chungangensis]
MNYKIKSLLFLSCFVLASLVYHNYFNEVTNDQNYASLEEVRISHENLKKATEEILKELE